MPRNGYIGTMLEGATHTAARSKETENASKKIPGGDEYMEALSTKSKKSLRNTKSTLQEDSHAMGTRQTSNMRLNQVLQMVDGNGNSTNQLLHDGDNNHNQNVRNYR